MVILSTICQTPVKITTRQIRHIFTAGCPTMWTRPARKPPCWHWSRVKMYDLRRRWRVFISQFEI